MDRPADEALGSYHRHHRHRHRRHRAGQPISQRPGTKNADDAFSGTVQIGGVCGVEGVKIKRSHLRSECRGSEELWRRECRCRSCGVTNVAAGAVASRMSRLRGAVTSRMSRLRGAVASRMSRLRGAVTSRMSREKGSVGALPWCGWSRTGRAERSAELQGRQVQRCVHVAGYQCQLISSVGERSYGGNRFIDPVSMGTLNPRWCRSVVCSRLRPVSMGTLKPPWSRSVLWSSC